MALPSLPVGSVQLSYTDLLTHFDNTADVPHNLSDYYGAQDTSTWTDPDASSGSGSTGRLVFFYRPRWTSTSYRGDYQLDSIGITDEVLYTFDYGADNWQYKVWSSSYSSYTALATAYSNSDTYSSISTASTTVRINRRYGSTPSSSTGVSNLGSYYIYAETSGSLQGFYGARSPEITIASGSQQLSIRFASYGSNCGPCYYYWMPTNDSNKTLIYAQTQINTTSIQNTTVTWTAP